MCLTSVSCNLLTLLRFSGQIVLIPCVCVFVCLVHAQQSNQLISLSQEHQLEQRGFAYESLKNLKKPG